MKKVYLFLLTILLTLSIMCVGCNSYNCSHTTQIGTCENCGNFQNQNNYNTIKKKISEATDLVDIVITSVSSIATNVDNYEQLLFSIIQSSQPQVEVARKCLTDAISISKNYSELDSITSSLYRAKNALPTMIAFSNSSAIQNYLTGLRLFLTENTSAKIQLLYIT